MNTYLKKLTTFMLIFSILTTTAYADVWIYITDAGKRVEIGDGKLHGVGHKYNPNDHTNKIYRRAIDRIVELRKVAKELFDKKKKAKTQREINDLAGMLDKVAREIKKNRGDADFEKELRKDPKSPTREPERGEWRRRKRKERILDLKKKQKAWEKEQKRRREEARRVRDYLNNYGMVDFNDVSSASQDVNDATDEHDRAMTDLQLADCDQDRTDDSEACNELRTVVNEATATMEEQESKLRELVEKLPPFLMAGGSIFSVGTGIFKLHKKYKEYLAAKRNVELCYQDCEELTQILEETQFDLEMEQEINKEPLKEVEDEHRAAELGEEIEATLIVPDYLTKHSEVPFSNEAALPLMFGLETYNSPEAFKGIKVLVNGDLLDASYYPETGIIRADYVGYEKKQGFEGKVIIEAVNGQTVEKSFGGLINSTKPEVKITKSGGGMFRRARFKVEVTGEFDRVEIEGTNIKAQSHAYETTQTKKQFTVKTLSRGEASINVKASLRTKHARVPVLDGTELQTGAAGRLENPEAELFPGLALLQGNVQKAEMGFCCEDVGDLTCEGCIPGRRTRKSCKALNRLPGYNIKAFLKASDLSCSKL